VASKSRHEGYLMIDHRESPGMSDADLVAGGMPLGAGRGLHECAIYTCNHCEFGIMKNPDRTRGREWCRYCDHYICDRCGAILAATGICKPFRNLVEEVQEMASRGADNAEIESSIILLS
jgi:hypothetical protein